MTPSVIEEPIAPPEAHLEHLLQRRLGSRVRDLRLVVRASGVVLQGRAATYHVKQLAQQAAMDIARLPVLANEIEVC